MAVDLEQMFLLWTSKSKMCRKVTSESHWITPVLSSMIILYILFLLLEKCRWTDAKLFLKVPGKIGRDAVPSHIGYFIDLIFSAG